MSSDNINQFEIFLPPKKLFDLDYLENFNIYNTALRILSNRRLPHCRLPEQVFPDYGIEM